MYKIPGRLEVTKEIERTQTQPHLLKSPDTIYTQTQKQRLEYIL